MKTNGRRSKAGGVLGCVRLAHSPSLLTCRERSLQLPGPLEAFRTGLLQKPSPGRREILHAGVAAFRGPVRPDRHRHGNGDAPLPHGPLRITLASQPHAADHMPVIADTVIVLDVGPFEAGVE